MRKYRFFVNLKKCQVYKKKIYYLNYVFLTKEVNIKDKKLKQVKHWSKLKLIENISVFISFINFFNILLKTSI